MRHLNDISTIWSLLEQAHIGSAEAENDAKQQLMERYGPAIQQYLAHILKDAHAAEELTQEFALRLVRGKFRHVDAGRGRFRDYVRTALSRLICDHFQKKRACIEVMSLEGLDDIALTGTADDEDFDNTWREELLRRAWSLLARARPKYYAVLRFRSYHADKSSAEIADYFSGQYGETITADGIRQTLRRARMLFCELLLDEVAHAMDAPTVDELEHELAALRLFDYCRPALATYRCGHSREEPRTK